MSMPAVYRNAQFLRRTEDLLSAEVQRRLIALRRELTTLLQRLPLDAVSAGYQLRRYEALVREADTLIQAAYAGLNTSVRTELTQLGVTQGKHARALLAELTRMDTVTLALPTRATLRAILTVDPIEGQAMGAWWKDQSQRLQRDFRLQMRMGMVRQESVPDLIKRIRGTRAPSGGYVGGLMNTSARGAEALVRTSVNEVANAAALATYSQDPTLSDEFEFVATLDDRTTEECQDADGRTFRYDDPGALVPPLHWNCRSTIVPVIKYDALGITPPTEERQTYHEWAATQ